MTSTLHDAFAYAHQNVYIKPLHTVTDGVCSCGDTSPNHKAGKHPRISGDGSNDPQQIRKWWKGAWEDSGIGIHLELSEIVDVAPDSPAWDAEFQRRGLPDTATLQSGSGEGHKHYLYRRPDGCPQTSINRSGEYDIKSNGIAVVPPSVSGKGPYVWLTPKPNLNGGLPDAPAWVVAMLKEQAAKRDTRQERRRERTEPDGGEAEEPPITLSGRDLAIWRGEEPILAKDGAGAVDRSATLLKIGRVLYDRGMTRRGIVAELQDTDHRRLGYHKFCERADADTQYHAIVDELEEGGRNPRVVFGDGPSADAGGTTADERAELRRSFTEAKERRRRARYAEMLKRDRLIRRLLRDPELSDGEKAHALIFDDVLARLMRRPSATGEYRLRMKQTADAYHIPRATLTARVDGLARTGAYTVRRDTTKGPILDPLTEAPITDPATGRPKIGYDTAVMIAPRAGGPGTGAAFLEAVVDRTFAPEAPRGRRKQRPRGRYCPKHPTARLEVETRTRWSCAICGAVVDERIRTRDAPAYPPGPEVVIGGNTPLSDFDSPPLPESHTHSPYKDGGVISTPPHRQPQGGGRARWDAAFNTPDPLSDFGSPPEPRGPTFRTRSAPRHGPPPAVPPELLAGLAAVDEGGGP